MTTETFTARVKNIRTMQLRSTGFPNEREIPPKYTADGRNFSPALMWALAPASTESFAITCEDIDAPSPVHPSPKGPWVHWIIFNIPATVRELPEALPRMPKLTHSVRALQGKNDFSSDNIGYRGPMPPISSGLHRYYFKIFALDCMLELDPTATNKAVLMDAMRGHIVGQGQCMGTYERTASHAPLNMGKITTL